MGVDTIDKNHTIDVYVGERLRQRRKALGLSQGDLGEMVDLSLQQIQKYEQGTNRIAASKLYEFSQVLRVPITYFYDGVDNAAISDNTGSNIISFKRKRPLAILLVEDNAADEVLTRMALEECTVASEIFAVHDGAEALQFLRNKKKANTFPRQDVILLDLNIPKVDGMAVLKEIKRDREVDDIPVIVLTNSISRQEMLDAYKKGASGFMTKSFNVEEFNKNISLLVEYWSSVLVLPSMG